MYSHHTIYFILVLSLTDSLRDYPPLHTPTLREAQAHRRHTLEETSLLVTGRHAIYTRRTTTLETRSLEYKAKNTHTHTHTLPQMLLVSAHYLMATENPPTNKEKK